MANEHFKMKIHPEQYFDYSRCNEFMDEELVFMDTVVIQQHLEDIQEELDSRRNKNDNS